jgi:hypothetical protein
MLVIKRDGSKQPVQFNEITSRIEGLCAGLSHMVKAAEVAQKVILGLADGMSTKELDELSAEIAASLSTHHPDYGKLAARLIISNLHKSTPDTFSGAMKVLYNNVDEKTRQNAPLISSDTMKVINDNVDILDAAIVNERDFSYEYFGYKTLTKSYLLKSNGQIVERPQYMLMRVAVGIHMAMISGRCPGYVLCCFLRKWFTHATPTLFNAGYAKASNVIMLPVTNAGRFY